ncbi:MAG: hypothetical protein KDA20_00825 [Phycisphaerales bacterium]|nr:hypothetical protein [Phycisphaerales bacterium]
MNTQQMDLIESSFNALSGQAHAIVARFYELLFSEHPELRSIFPADLTEQRKHLVGAIGLVVKNVRDLEKIEPGLEEMGARHVGYGAKPEHYGVVASTLIASLKEFAGDLWTPEIEHAWSQALNAVATVMLHGAERAGTSRKAA